MGFRVRDRVGIRDRVRARCVWFCIISSSVLELKICPFGKEQVHRTDFANITIFSSHHSGDSDVFY